MKKLSFQEIQNLINHNPSTSLPLPRLEAIRRAFQDLNPKIPIDKVILVAGTNGKGTVAKTLQTLLSEEGKSVGLLTSPHLLSICERLQINGKSISEILFAKCFQQIFTLYEKWHLNHTEVLTLMAIELFFKGRLLSPIEYGIFEVGLGGLYDPTNVIPHQTSIITQISYDHEHILGFRLKDIAIQKLGIISKNNFEKPHDVVASSIFNVKQPLHKLKEQITHAVWHTSAPWSYRTENIDGHPKGFISIYGQKQEMSLLGARAAENMALALKAYHVLGFSPQNALKSLQKVKWEGRMHQEPVSFCKCPVYFSGDHNVQGIKSLIDILQDFHYQRIYFLLSVGQKKDPKNILPYLMNVKNAHIYLTTATFKGRSHKEYGKWINKCNGYKKNPIEAFMSICRQCQKDDLMIVTGSLYLVGELLSYVRYRKAHC